MQPNNLNQHVISSKSISVISLKKTSLLKLVIIQYIVKFNYERSFK